MSAAAVVVSSPMAAPEVIGAGFTCLLLALTTFTYMMLLLFGSEDFLIDFLLLKADFFSAESNNFFVFANLSSNASLLFVLLELAPEPTEERRCWPICYVDKALDALSASLFTFACVWMFMRLVRFGTTDMDVLCYGYYLFLILLTDWLPVGDICNFFDYGRLLLCFAC